MTRPKILLVEDSQTLGPTIYDQLTRIGETAWMMTESEFRSYRHFIEADLPDVIVLDIMLAWTEAGDQTHAQPDEAKDLYTAGIRCAEMLAANEKTRDVPIVFYTVVPQNDVAERVAKLPNVTYVQKWSEIASVVSDVLRLRSSMIRASG